MPHVALLLLPRCLDVTGRFMFILSCCRLLWVGTGTPFTIPHTPHMPCHNTLHIPHTPHSIHITNTASHHIYSYKPYIDYTPHIPHYVDHIPSTTPHHTYHINHTIPQVPNHTTNTTSHMPYILLTPRRAYNTHTPNYIPCYTYMYIVFTQSINTTSITQIPHTHRHTT